MGKGCEREQNAYKDRWGQDYQGNGDQLTPMEFLHV